MTTEKEEAKEAVLDSETQAAEKQDQETTETADTTEKVENNTEETVEVTTEEIAADTEASTEETKVEKKESEEETVEASAGGEETEIAETATEETAEASEEPKEEVADEEVKSESPVAAAKDKESVEEKSKPDAKKKSDSKGEENQPKEETAKAEKPTAKTKARKIEDEPLKDFDWTQVDSELDEYSKEDREKLEKLYGDSLKSISEGEVVVGTIVSMNNREVIINIGFKSESVVSISEFRYNADIKVGDEVDVFIEIQEDKNGQLILSHKQARALMAWDKVNDALDTDEVITGFVKCRTKGGLIVDVFGIEAFLPGSQIDVKPVRDYDMYVGKTMEFRVVKINKEFKNVVVSHKALIESELKEQRKGIIAKLEKGQVLEGMVKNITSYGVFMDLGGVDGLVHITDLSWGRISHPEEIVSLDEKLNVVILDFDENKTRIQLGLKQLKEHPWDSLDKDLKPGTRLKGKVVVVADYGAFVEIAPGIEGLIHVSEMSWSQHLRSAQDFLKVGDELEVEMLTIDREERKMSFGLRQLTADPWKGVEKKYPVDSKHSGLIRNFTNYGIFVELEEGVDGLIHISDLSWSKKIKHPSEFANLGDKIEIVILELDTEDRKVSLGHKQLEENPWEVFETVFTVDSVHKGTLTQIVDKGGIVTLPYGVEGFVPGRHLTKSDGTKAEVDESLDFKVLEFSKDGKRILLSHLNTYSESSGDSRDRKPDKKSKGKSIRKAVKEVRDSLESTTLGDIDALSSLKDKMEDNEKKERKESSKVVAEAEEEATANAPADAPDAAKEEKPEEPKAEKTPVEEESKDVESNESDPPADGDK